MLILISFIFSLYCYNQMYNPFCFMLGWLAWLSCANEKWFSGRAKKKAEDRLISQPCSPDVERIGSSSFIQICSSKSERMELARFTLMGDEPSINTSWRWIFGQTFSFFGPASWHHFYTASMEGNVRNRIYNVLQSFLKLYLLLYTRL